MKANYPGNLGKYAMANMQIASILEPKWLRKLELVSLWREGPGRTPG
jgi:hypothetical protein